YDSGGNAVADYLSRAGAGNPPPAASANSGGSADGWRTTINIDASGKISVYFDGILKFSYRAGSTAGSVITSGALLAEREGVASMDTQLVSRHLRELKFSGAITDAFAFYNPSSTSFPCTDADI